MKQGLLFLALIIISCSVVLYSFLAYADEMKAESMSIDTMQNTAEHIAKDAQELKEKEEKKKAERKRKEEIRKQKEAKDIDLLARTINAEAGSTVCTYEMRLFVGSVIANRVQSELFPDTLEGVIYQAGQFECVTNGMIYKEAIRESKEIAERIIKEGSALPADVLYFAEFTQGSGIYAKLQNLYFCYR